MLAEASRRRPNAKIRRRGRTRHGVSGFHALPRTRSGPYRVWQTEASRLLGCGAIADRGAEFQIERLRRDRARWANAGLSIARIRALYAADRLQDFASQAHDAAQRISWKDRPTCCRRFSCCSRHACRRPRAADGAGSFRSVAVLDRPRQRRSPLRPRSSPSSSFLSPKRGTPRQRRWDDGKPKAFLLPKGFDLPAPTVGVRPRGANPCSSASSRARPRRLSMPAHLPARS